MRLAISRLVVCCVMELVLAVQTLQANQDGRGNIVVTIDGVEHRAADVSWSSDEITLVTGKTSQIIPWSKIAVYCCETRPEDDLVWADAADRQELHLTNRDRLIGTLIDVDDERIQFRLEPSRSVKPLLLSIPAGQATTWYSRTPRTPIEQSSIDQFSIRGPDAGDQLRLKNGDTSRGTLESVRDGNLSWLSAMQPTLLDMKRVERIDFDPRLATTAPAANPGWILLLRNGSRLTAGQVTHQSKGWDVTLETGEKIWLPRAEITSMVRRSPQVIPVIDREIRSEETPFLSLTRSVRTDRNVFGGPLVVGKSALCCGFGVQARSSIELAVAEGDRFFWAIVGVDDVAADRARVRFKVQLDGRTAWESPALQRGALQTVGPVPLGEAKLITLITDFGEPAGIGPPANWCNVVLLRQ